MLHVNISEGVGLWRKSNDVKFLANTKPHFDHVFELDLHPSSKPKPNWPESDSPSVLSMKLLPLPRVRKSQYRQKDAEGKIKIYYFSASGELPQTGSRIDGQSVDFTWKSSSFGSSGRINGDSQAASPGKTSAPSQEVERAKNKVEKLVASSSER